MFGCWFVGCRVVSLTRFPLLGPSSYRAEGQWGECAHEPLGSARFQDSKGVGLTPGLEGVSWRFHRIHQSLKGNMSISAKYRWRKATDINREFAIFELLSGEEVLLDVGYSEKGVLEVSFNETIVGLVFDWPRLQELIEEGRKLADLDR